jgi:pilus assembly protein FimV
MKISGLVWALLLAAGASEAAGLGKLTVQSALGQPLKAEIELLSVNKDELADITAKLASADAFKQARIERVESLGTLRFSVEQRANGQPVIRITSSAGVADPFLDLLIELNWNSGRLIREYTILLDPLSDAKPAEPVRPAVVPESGRNGEIRVATSPQVEAQKAKPAPVAGPAPAAPKRYGPVRSGETLRGIAGKVKPADVSLEQMMVGLYQANKEAFFEGNMNRMKRGHVLNVPEADAARASTPREAARTVQGHALEWHAYRKRLATMAEAVPMAEEQPAAGKITPKAEEKPTPAPGAPKDVLKLSKGEPGSAGGKPDAKTQERLHGLEEEIAAKSRALQEAQDRVGQLERTVRDMQKLLELKAQEAAKAPPPAPVAKPAEPPKVEAVPPAPVPAPSAAPAPAVQPKPAPAPVPVPVEESSSSWISTFISNPLYIGGLLAAVLLSGLLWMMMVGSRRRQGLTKFEDSIMTGGEFKNNVVFNAAVGGAPAGAATEGSMLLTDFSRLGMGAIDSHEVDPIAEAEVYMAYGRDAQAEEILKEALAKDPGRHEIALKLMEIYASRKDTLAFETTASELYAGLGGQNTPVWQRAAEMGRSIDPDNPLYRIASTTSPGSHGLVGAGFTAAQPAVAARQEFPPPIVVAPAEETPTAPEGLGDLGALDDWSPSPDSGTKVPEFSSGQHLDWPSETVVAPAVEPPAGGKDEANVMAFDADEAFALPEPDREGLQTEAELSLPEPAPEMMEELTVEPLLESAVQEAPVQEPSLDFDLPTEAAPSEAEAIPELDLSGIDLDMAVAEAPPAEIELEAAPEVPAEFEAAMDFEPAQVVMPAVAEPEAVVEEPVEAGEVGMDAELREEVNTKLDLAKAYLEMGDREGAREILNEVLNEGDDGQKAEAGKLMAEAG